MKNEKTIKDFEKLYAGKVIRLNEDLMPVILNPTKLPKFGIIEHSPGGDERILKYPDCRSALAIMIREYGALYLPEKPSRD